VINRIFRSRYRYDKSENASNAVFSVHIPHSGQFAFTVTIQSERPYMGHVERMKLGRATKDNTAVLSLHSLKARYMFFSATNRAVS
jgi:hypothetical protein